MSATKKVDKENKDFYVYALLDTRKEDVKYGRYIFEHQPFYIGKGCKTRFLEHCRLVNGELVYGSSNPLKSRIIKKIYNETGELPKVVIKKSGLNEAEAFALEKKLIKLIGRRDLKQGPLSNLTSGGDGCAGYVKKENQLKISSEKMRAYMANMTEEEYTNHCMKLSIAIKNWHVNNPKETWLKERVKIIKAGLAKLTKEEEATRRKRIGKGVKNFWAGLTPEEKQVKIDKQQQGFNNLSKQEKERINKAKSKVMTTYFANSPKEEQDRLKLLWSNKRQEAWNKRTPEQRTAIGQKISESKKKAFAKARKEAA